MKDKKELPVVIKFKMDKNEEKSNNSNTNYTTSLKTIEGLSASLEMKAQLVSFLVDGITDLEDALKPTCAMTISRVQIEIKPFLP